MQIKIHEQAAKEFEDAIEWYELQPDGLGERFRNAVVGQINKIRVHPRWYLIDDRDIYKAYVSKFPFKILFTIDDGNIVIFGQ